jgi:hypothetical protein
MDVVFGAAFNTQPIGLFSCRERLLQKFYVFTVLE